MSPTIKITFRQIIDLVEIITFDILYLILIFKIKLYVKNKESDVIIYLPGFVPHKLPWTEQ